MHRGVAARVSHHKRNNSVPRHGSEGLRRTYQHSGVSFKPSSWDFNRRSVSRRHSQPAAFTFWLQLAHETPDRTLDRLNAIRRAWDGSGVAPAIPGWADLVTHLHFHVSNPTRLGNETIVSLRVSLNRRHGWQSLRVLLSQRLIHCHRGPSRILPAQNRVPRNTDRERAPAISKNPVR